MTDPAARTAPSGPPPRGSRYPSTALALIGAVIGCLGIVAFIILVVVRPDSAPPRTTDWRAVAAEAADPALLAPELPEGWTANYAELSSEGDVQVWRIGFLSPTSGFVGMVEALESTDAWVAEQLRDGAIGEPVRIGGLTWATADRRDDPDAGNRAFTMVASFDAPDPRAVALYGRASDEDFRTVAEAIAREAAS